MPGCVITLPKTVSERLDLSFCIFARRGEKYSCYMQATACLWVLGLRLLHTDYDLLFILSIIILINSEGPFKVIPIYVSISTVMIELFILKLAK